MRGELALDICKLRLEVQVLKSNAGYYLGTFDEQGPVSRESEYFRTSEEAQAALDNNTFTQRQYP